jgi:uncharacterized membrane protein
VSEFFFKLEQAILKKKFVSAACPTDDVSNDDAELGIDNVGGVFLVLGIGVFAAYLIVIFEFLWNVKSAAVEKKVKLEFKCFGSFCS